MEQKRVGTQMKLSKKEKKVQQRKGEDGRHGRPQSEGGLEWDTLAKVQPGCVVLGA